MRVTKSAHTKFTFLMAETAKRGGKLTSQGAVAKAIKQTSGNLSQLFGSGSHRAESSINPRTLGDIVSAFQKDGLDMLSVAMFMLPDGEFVQQVSESSSPLRPTSPFVVDDRSMGEGSLPIAEWLPDEPVAYTELVAAHIHPLRPMSNSRPDCYYLDVSLWFDTSPHILEDQTHTVTIGLHSARLVLESTAYQIAHGSLLGDTGRPLDGVRPTINGIVITASADEQWLSRSPLGEHYLAALEPAGKGSPIVTITVQAEPRHFTFELSSDGDAGNKPAPLINKQVILGLAYRESIESRHKAHPTGRMILARASMRRINRDS